MKINNQEKVSNKTPLAVPSGNSGEFLSMHQASKMTGYHQDYLGQLARGGKLEAHKVGRNWFTTKLAIDKMLGRVQEEKKEEVVIASVQEPVVVIKEAEPTAPVAPVINVVREVTEVAPKIAEVVAPEKIKIFTPRINPRIKINHLNISHEAGPNLQEELIASVVEEKEEQVQIVGIENKNFYYRWMKLAGQGQKEKIELARIKNELKKVTSELHDTQKYISEKYVPAPIQKTAFASWKVWAVGLTTICLSIFGTAYFVSNYFSDVSESLSRIPQLEEKRVAGESTDVYENDSVSPPQNDQIELIPKGTDSE